jgi:hypothetical protein
MLMNAHVAAMLAVAGCAALPYVTVCCGHAWYKCTLLDTPDGGKQEQV